MKKAPEAFRTISEVADLLETPAHVLRFWESKFYQIRPVKRAGGRRYYRPDDVSLIAGIRHLLQDRGMTIRGVQKILQEQGVKHVMKLAPPLSAPPPQTGAVVEADLPPAIAPDAMPGREEVRPAHAAGSSPPAPVPPARPQPVVPPPRFDASETPAAGAVPPPEPAPADVGPEVSPGPEAEHRSPPADIDEAIPAPSTPRPEAPSREAPAFQKRDPASAPGRPVAEAAPSDAPPPDATMKGIPPAPATADKQAAARDGGDTPLAPAQHPVADPLAPSTAAPHSVPPQPETAEPFPFALAEDRPAQRLRHLPPGALDRRAGQLALIARRLDTLLDRMSEASGAGRW